MALRRQSRAFVRLFAHHTQAQVWQHGIVHRTVPMAAAAPSWPASDWRALLLQQQAAALHTSLLLRSAVPAPQQETSKRNAGPPGDVSRPLRVAPVQDNDDEPVADAQECDKAIGTLQQTYKATRRKPPGYASAANHVRNFVNTVFNGTLVVLRWTLALPGRVVAFAMLPGAERSKTYAHWWSIVKKEARHYWAGTKLLAADVRIASGLTLKLLRGKQLSRRERKQLTRTAADVFRLVPMLVFVIVPFMEFLLPVALKLFPNMLPSQYEDKLKKEEEMKKRLAVKIEMARFLQDTMEEMASNMKQNLTGSVQASAEELYNFMKKVRAGEPVSNGDIVRFAKLFNDELTLDNLDRLQLVSLCKFVGLAPFGTDAFLRARLRAHLASIKADDRSIREEGIENLTSDELRSACRARGMRYPFGEFAVPFMRLQLEEWLDLSLNRALPSSLLLLSRAWLATQPIEAAAAEGARNPHLERLKETLSSLPDDVIEDVGLEACSDSGERSDLEKRLEILRKEQELIEEEEEAQLAAAEVLPDEGAGQALPGSAAQLTAAAAAAAVVREAAASTYAEMHIEGASEEERMAQAALAKSERMQQVLSALAVLASSSGVASERQQFMGLVKDEIDRLKSQGEASSSSNSLTFTGGQLQVDTKCPVEEEAAAKRLSDRVSGILSRIERELDVVEAKIGDKLKVLDMDNDGVISMDEIKAGMAFLHTQLGEEELQSLLERLNAESRREVPVRELMQLATAGRDEAE